MPYAALQDGLGALAVPMGALGVASPTYEPGFRIGGQWALDPCTAVAATFSWFENTDPDITLGPGGFAPALTAPGLGVEVLIERISERRVGGFTIS